MLSWQDRRAAAWLSRFDDRAPAIKERNGLPLSPHYGASKLRWLLDNVPAVQQARQEQRLAFGPLATFLLFHLLRDRPFLVDHANAARTQLWHIDSRDWDPWLLDLFGQPGQFRDWTELVGLQQVGPLLARGSAVADFDNDGDLDVAVNTIAGAAVLLRNEAVADKISGNWLRLAFDGFYPGAVATVTLPDGRSLMREWHVGSSYLASEDPRLHFGLADTTVVPTVTVRWPDGRTLTLPDVEANQQITLSPPPP